MVASAAVGAVVVSTLAVVVGGTLYLLPTISGTARNVVNIGSVFAINLFLGWTLALISRTPLTGVAAVD